MGKVLALLECGHTMLARVAQTQLYAAEKCLVCKDWETVAIYYKAEWHTKCGACRFGRSHGQARAYAERAAVQHQGRTGHHVSVTYYADVPPSLPEPANKFVQKELPIDPPF